MSRLVPTVYERSQPGRVGVQLPASDVPVPAGLVQRMQRAEKTDTEAQEGLAIARELAVAVRELVQGIQVYVPGGQLDTALAVLEAL